MKIVPFTRRTVSHNNAQSFTAETGAKYEYVYIEDYNDSLVYAVIRKSIDVFHAMRKVEGINRLNGYEVFSDWDIRRIKKHYTLEKTKTEKTKANHYKYHFVENEFPRQQRENRKYEYGRRERGFNYDIEKEMKKGYMRMLSAYENSI